MIVETAKPCAMINWVQPEGDVPTSSEYSTSALTFRAFLDEKNSFCICPDDGTKQKITETFTCSSNTLYIMFTSGSTGVPKGVCASTAGTLNRFNWMWNAFPFNKGQVMCFKTSVLFVDSIWEIFGSVLKGVPLAIPTPGVARDPRLLLSFLSRHSVTHLTSTPTLLRHLLGLASATENLSTLAFCFASGEPLSVALCSQFFNTLPSCRLVNLYGTTEICADITYFEVTVQYLLTSTGPLVPIGRPISNLYVEVVNTLTHSVVSKENSQEQGELVVYGSCVADGYLDSNIKPSGENRYAGTPNSFNTHDIVYYTSCGNLMYSGRSDHQIKLGGIKINPCEVEAILEQYSGVTRAAVVANESKLSLVGFIKLSQCHPVFENSNPSNSKFSFMGIDYVVDQAINRKLSEHLVQHLPQHSIPSQFICSQELPCLPSGKINRLQLPSTSDITALSEYPDTTDFARALSKTEKTLTELITQTLGLGPVSLNLSDNFVSMGGNSLLAIDLSVQLEKCFGYSVLIHDLLSGLSIRTLASMIDNWISTHDKAANTMPSNSRPQTTDKSVDSVNSSSHVGNLDEKQTRQSGGCGNPGEPPLLLTQHMVWLAQQSIEKEGIVIEIAALCLECVDAECLRQSVQHLFLRHESLRTLIRENKRGIPFRHVIPLNSTDFAKLQGSVFSVKSCLSLKSQQDQVPIFDGNQIRLPKFHFDLESGPLWQATLFKDVANKSNGDMVDVLAFQFHHILIDGWSLKMIMVELGNVYKHLVAGGSMEDLPVEYSKPPTVGMDDIVQAELANLQDQAANSKKFNYWVNHLKHCTAPMLLPAELSFSLAYNETETSSIYRSLKFRREDIENSMKTYGVSEFVLTYTSFLLSMYAATGNQDITIYLPVANRTPISAHVVGMVVETMPLRVTMSPGMPLDALLFRVKTAGLELFQNMHPYVLVDQWLRNKGEIYVSHPISGHYLQTMFVFDYDRTSIFSSSSMFKEIPVCERFTACAITIYVHMDRSHEDLGIHIIYNTEWFDARTINAFLEAWEAIIPIISAVSSFDKTIQSLSKQVYPLASCDILSSNLVARGLAPVSCDTGLVISLGGSSPIHVCPSQMDHIVCGIKQAISSHSITEIAVVHPMSALLCALVAASAYLGHDVQILPSKEVLCNYLMERPHMSSVLVILPDYEVSNVNEFVIRKQLSSTSVHVVSSQSFLISGSHKSSLSMTKPSAVTILLSEDDHRSDDPVLMAPCSCSSQCVQLLTPIPQEAGLTSSTKVQHVRHQDVLTVRKCFCCFEHPKQAAIFATPQCPTFPIAIALLLEGIPLRVYTDADISKISSLANLTGIQEADLLITPEILIPRLIQDLPQTWPPKQAWIHGLPLGLAHVGESAERHFARVLVTHSLLPDDVLITHHFQLDGFTAPPTGTSWIPLGHAVDGLIWKIEYPDGREAVPGFPGRFAVLSASKVTLYSNAVVKQAISGQNAGSHQLLSLQSDAYYRGNDRTPLVVLLGQLPNIKWCHPLREGVLFTECTNDNAAIVEKVLVHLQPSLVKYMYATNYPPAMASHFMVDGLQTSSTRCTARLQGVIDGRFEMVLKKVSDIVADIFCIEAEEIERNCYLSSIGGYCMENYFQLTLKINYAFNTCLTFRDVSQILTMHDLVVLVLSKI